MGKKEKAAAPAPARRYLYLRCGQCGTYFTKDSIPVCPDCGGDLSAVVTSFPVKDRRRVIFEECGACYSSSRCPDCFPSYSENREKCYSCLCHNCCNARAKRIRDFTSGKTTLLSLVFEEIEKRREKRGAGEKEFDDEIPF